MSADKLLSNPIDIADGMQKSLDVILTLAEKPELLLEARKCGGNPLASSLIEECVFEAGGKLYTEYGEPPTTRMVSCIHAAGFAATLDNIGISIESIRIHMAKKGFSGNVHHGKIPLLADPTLAVFRDAIAYSSGFGAEEHMGMAHPSAAIPSKLIAAIFCNYLDKTLRKERGHFFQKAIAHNKSVLVANRHVFDLLTFTLFRSGSINSDEARKAFKSVRRISFSLDGEKA